MPISADARKRQIIEQEVVAFTECGALHGCPFCIGRMQSDLKRGEKITFLSGLNVGRIATVYENTKSGHDVFQVVFPKSTRGTYYNCSFARDKYIRFPLPPVPDWLCPFSIEDLSYLEESILHVIFNSIQTEEKPDIPLLVKNIASVVWQRRLLVTGAKFFETLQHHGFRDEWKQAFSAYFDFAVDLLTSNHRRPAIKRKLVPPMSIARYTTDTSRESRIQLFGFDPATSPFSISASGSAMSPQSSS